ncbi:hypothetical protein NQ317_017945 [Molorchus minor]|uniref:Alpha-galactosidase n=1 Tax=Molorchus minor TaxID=1323400 RepID=A0ABQ9JFZ5_9CUCU|nr:hypothetical protein NQ317_017945 [Molorchus minor]
MASFPVKRTLSADYKAQSAESAFERARLSVFKANTFKNARVLKLPWQLQNPEKREVYFTKNRKMFEILWTLLAIASVKALDNGLALTPPMGWLAWQRFRCLTDCITYPDECISENLFKAMADRMSSDGYLEAGYEYVIIDDCWASKERDNDSRLQPDPARFPGGIKNLSDYIHSKGLKFGIYADYGTHTCAGYPGSIDYLKIDAQTFAEWGVDYLKLDGCYADVETMPEGYGEMGQYLNETGRPIVYSCSQPAYQEPKGINPNYTKLAETCNLWRNWDDIDDAWSNVTNILGWFSSNQDRIASFSGPGHWNDPDMVGISANAECGHIRRLLDSVDRITGTNSSTMRVSLDEDYYIHDSLLLGNFGLSYEQSKAQMAIWAILAAPLLMSVDLRTIDPIFRDILQNKDVIAINQDPMGVQGRLVLTKSTIDIWTKPITPHIEGSDSYAIGVLSNRVDGYPYRLNFTLLELNLTHIYGYTIKDVYDPSSEPRDVDIDQLIFVRVKPSGVVLLTATPNSAINVSLII